ncbi:alpha/beta fold hydrolase [Massilia sp. TN1-12]|uniref:alpha/beta fold hydrolase n=1 Tax=Massilia paldalensis TaxID=3377675 RepID=UPI00384D7636
MDKDNDGQHGASASARRRNNVHVAGAGERTIVFAHGYGCDQSVWRWVAPAFEPDHRVVTFDHVGAGASDLSAYDPVRHATLEGYADDLLAICAEMALSGIVYVGHSVSAMIGVLAAIRAPEVFERLVLVGPSPCYLNDGDYAGGFAQRDLDELLDLMDSNFVHWSATMAPVIMNAPDRTELAEELAGNLCRLDPAVARQFARVTFLSDHRADLGLLRRPSLILQCRDDAIAPLAVGDYMRRHMAGSTLRRMAAAGHCPHMSAPAETIAAVRAYLEMAPYA